MARPATGAVIVSTTSRGPSYALRFTAYGKRRFVTLGHESTAGTVTGLRPSY